jgi:SAM-dependent methyltransferase
VSRSRARARSAASSTSGASRRAANAVASDYSFGHSRRAADRLALVARNFEPTSRAFLEEAAPRGCARALDLGCGPGFTTRLLREVCAPGELVGLDASESFVALAAASEAPGLAYQVHDVTQMPFPGGAADLIHARLLLSHLADAESVVVSWWAQLRPGGRLLLDEVESIRSEDPAFEMYLSLVRQLLASRGQQLEIGPRIERATRVAQRVHCELRELTLPPARAAEMFAPNLAEFRTQAAIRAQAREDVLDELAAGLRLRVQGKSGAPVTWCMRQLAIEA